MDARGTQQEAPSADILIGQVITALQRRSILPGVSTALHELCRSVLFQKKVLILVDNARDTEQIAPLFALLPANCVLIVTTRNSATLNVADVGLFKIDRLPDSDAVALLQQFDKKFLDIDTAGLIHMCAGSPLALRLAGAQLACEALERQCLPQVAAYLERSREDRLRTIDTDMADTGKATITGCLRDSEVGLSEEQRAAWHKLSIFTASFGKRAAAAVAGAGDDLLKVLVDRNLLETEGSARLRLHDFAADYARSKLELDPRRLHAVSLHHAHHYTAVTTEANLLYTRGRMGDGLSLFDLERVHIDAAFSFLTHQDDAVIDHVKLRSLIDLANSVGNISGGISDVRFHEMDQAIPWWAAQRDAARALMDRRAEAAAISKMSTAYISVGNVQSAIECSNQALPIHREVGDRCAEAYELDNLGICLLSQKRIGEAIEHHEQALKIAVDLGDAGVHAKMTVLANFGNSLRARRGDHILTAVDHHLQAVKISHQLGERRSEAFALANLGSDYKTLSKLHDTDADLSTRIDYLKRAIDCYQTSQSILHELGDRHAESSMLLGLGRTYSSVGDIASAITSFDKAIILLDDLNGVQANERLRLERAALQQRLLKAAS